MTILSFCLSSFYYYQSLAFVSIQSLIHVIYLYMVLFYTYSAYCTSILLHDFDGKSKIGVGGDEDGVVI